MRTTLVILYSVGFKIYVLAPCALHISEYMANSWQMVAWRGVRHGSSPGPWHLTHLWQDVRKQCGHFSEFLKMKCSWPISGVQFLLPKNSSSSVCVRTHHYPISSSSESHRQLGRTSVLVSCSLAQRLNFLLLSCLSQPSCPDITYLWICTYENML